MTPLWGRSGFFRVGCAIACVAVAILPLATGPASASTGGTGYSPSAPSGTAYWAEGPESFPNWIFPYTPLQYYSVATVQQFQQLMFRPLYWLSASGAPGLNATESLANPPVFSAGDSVVTIPLKGWRWSNGTSVDAQDVIFWMNMLRSEKDNPSSWVASRPPPGPAAAPR